MLLTRVITALVLIPFVVAAVLGLPAWGLAILVGVIAALSAHEWAQFALPTQAGRVAYAVICGSAVWGVYALVERGGIAPYLAGGGIAFWLGMAVWVGRYPQGFVSGVGQATSRLTTGAGILLLFAAAALQLAQQPAGRELILVTLVLVWAMDVGGYFFGKRFGKHKLAPLVSPNKSWEGFWGGALLALIVAVVAALYVLPLSVGQVAVMTVLGVLVSMASVLGDLAESMFKRQAGIKDSGALLPGHGGLLDRLDSSYAALPLMQAGWLILFS